MKLTLLKSPGKFHLMPTTKLELFKKAKKVKVWYEQAGKGHFMVLVSCLYDPAFYYTPQELPDKGNDEDVVSMVEKPCSLILDCQMSNK